MKPKSTILFTEIKQLIIDSKQQLALSVNATLTLLYWEVGNRINKNILQNERAEYGKQIIKELSEQLTQEYGKGWGKRQLHHCVTFATVFNNKQIVNTLCTQLSWSHFRLLIPITEPLKREFYIQLCVHEKWSVRTFKERIKSMLYERTSISKQPEKTIKNDLELLKNEQIISSDLIFKDPYLLDFLNLKNTYSEQDLESSILVELQQFLTELGADFAFLSRQKRIIIDDRDYYIDLLFYHRRLKALVVIDLKIGEFEAAHKGQMELYLNYLEKHETIEGENLPVGLILCTGKNQEHIELMSLDNSNIKVAEYITVLPPQHILQAKLQQAVKIAQNKLQENEDLEK